MKFTTLIPGLLAVTLGMSSVAYAKHGDVYYPPERINCSLSTSGQLSCGEFERSYLTEGRHTADFNPGQQQTFTFSSAAAYFTNNHQEARIFFTYSLSKDKVVRLETFDTSIMPDLASGSWKPLNNIDDIYICNEGYMSCGITSLPSK